MWFLLIFIEEDSYSYKFYKLLLMFFLNFHNLKKANGCSKGVSCFKDSYDIKWMFFLKLIKSVRIKFLELWMAYKASYYKKY